MIVPVTTSMQADPLEELLVEVLLLLHCSLGSQRNQEIARVQVELDDD